MIRIEYQLAFDEWVEAARVQVRTRMWVAIIAASVFSAIILLPPPSASAAFGLGALEPLLVWLAIFALIWVMVFFLLGALSRKPWRKKSRRVGPIMPVWFRRLLVPLASLSLTACVLTIRWSYEFDAARADAARTGVPFSEAATVLSTLMLTAIWAIYSIVPAVIGMVSRTGGIFGWPYTQSWKTQPHIRRPMTAEFLDTGCLISEQLSRHEYHWDYFPGWAETPNLFVFYITNRSMHIFPKRAFASDAQRIEFVQLIERHISESLPAFPVQPVAGSSAQMGHPPAIEPSASRAS
jgi:hypothetical protein